MASPRRIWQPEDGAWLLVDPVLGERLFDGHRLRCTVFGTGPKRYATFDSFAGRKAYFADCAPSRKAIAAGYQHIVIQTAQNDWYLNDDLKDLCAALRQHVSEVAVSKALGFSMGAFAALLFADALKLKELFLVSLRFPRPMGWVGRAKVNCTDALLAPYWQDHLISAASAAPETVAFFDPRKFDDRLAVRWLQGISPQIHGFSLAFGGHPCTGYINQANRFGLMQDILLGQGVVAGDLVRLKKIARAQSQAYRSNVDDYLALRKSRGLPSEA